VGSVVGTIAGPLFLLCVADWRRQRKKTKMQEHGKVEEAELSHHMNDRNGSCPTCPIRVDIGNGEICEAWRHRETMI
jgi:hypothetical protein